MWVKRGEAVGVGRGGSGGDGDGGGVLIHQAEKFGHYLQTMEASERL